MTSIWELPNVYFQNLLLINNTPDNNLQPQMHICPLPCTPFEQKLAESAYFANWRKWPQFESCQMYIFKIYSSSTIHQTTTFNLKCIFVHSHAHPWAKIGWVSIFLKNRFQIDANDLNLRVAKCIFSKSTQMTSFVSCNNIINNTPDNNLQPQMHICPLPCTPFEQKLAESAYF